MSDPVIKPPQPIGHVFAVAALAIVVASMGFTLGKINSGAVASVPQNQVAAVVSGGAVDMQIVGVTTNGNQLSLRVKNVGGGTVQVPAFVDQGLCWSAAVFGSNDVNSIVATLQGCADQSVYPITAGKEVSMPINFGDSLGAVGGKTIKVGIDGVFFSISQDEGFYAVPSLNQITESNELNNNQLSYVIPATFGQANLALNKTPIIRAYPTNAASNCAVTGGGINGGVDTRCALANASSTWSGPATPSASYITNNVSSNTDFWCSGNQIKAAGQYETVTVDLGKESVVSRVAVDHTANTPYACGKATDYKVQYSMDNVTWTDAPGSAATNNTDVIKYINFTSPVAAKYIRYYVTKVNGDYSGWHMGIKEMRVWGGVISNNDEVVMSKEDAYQVCGGENEAEDSYQNCPIDTNGGTQRVWTRCKMKDGKVVTVPNSIEATFEASIISKKGQKVGKTARSVSAGSVRGGCAKLNPGSFVLINRREPLFLPLILSVPGRFGIMVPTPVLTAKVTKLNYISYYGDLLQGESDNTYSFKPNVSSFQWPLN